MKTLTLFSMVACSLIGQVTYDNSTLGQAIAPDASLTFAHTTGSGSNRALGVFCTVAGPSATVMTDISTVTYADVSLTQLAKINANYDTYIWTLPNGTQPTSGANNVVVTLAAALATNGSIKCVAITVAGVDATTTWSVSDCSGSGSSGNATCTLGASGSNDLVVFAACHGTGWSGPGANITSRQSINDVDNACSSFALGTAPGNTTSLTWNTAASDFWQAIGAAFKASGGGGPTVVTNKRIYVM